MVFNNTVFDDLTISTMSDIHPSIERLYLAAKALRDVAGLSAVARLLGVTPQVVKNWETRGLSSEGALLAQKMIGCNANWLLEEIKQMENTAWTPAAAVRTHVANDISAPPFKDDAWPFSKVSREQFKTLGPRQRAHVEDGILILLNAEASSSNQAGPQSDSAAA